MMALTFSRAAALLIALSEGRRAPLDMLPALASAGIERASAGSTSAVDVSLPLGCLSWPLSGLREGIYFFSQFFFREFFNLSLLLKTVI